jgi:hypothetical protein
MDKRSASRPAVREDVIRSLNPAAHRSSWGRSLGLLVLMAVVGFLLVACSAASPRIVVEPSSQDLGERPQELIELSYTIRNEGGSPLKIEKLSTSCACTRAEVDKEVLTPGESTRMRVTLDPTEDDLYGDILRVIYIRSNDPAHPEVEVEFRVTLYKSGEKAEAEE